MSERISESTTTSDLSRLVSALNLALNSQNDTVIPSGQFGFKATIQTDKTVLSSTDFDFEFDIPFDDDTVPNEATITIFNLSNSTINNFAKDNELTVTAGYGDDTGIILRGKISNIKTKHSGVDKITEVKVLDNADYKDIDIVEQTYTEGVTASYILQDLISKLNLNVAVFEVQRNHTYDSDVSVKGSITEAIKKYANVCGVSVYIHKLQVYCRPIWKGDNIHFTVCPDTGMIDSPEPFEEESTSEEYKDVVTGYNISMLLQHRVATAAIVEVSSKDYKGTYRVCSGTHTFDGLSAQTEIKCIENISTTIEQKETSSSGSSGTASSTDTNVSWSKKEVPLGQNNYPKTYMSYRLYTDETASGYKYLHGSDSWTNAAGFRMYKNCICIAMGSYYGANGTFVKIEWTNPDGSKKTIVCVKGDQKKDSETDSNHQYHPMEGGTGSVCEFIVDGEIITSQSKMYEAAKIQLGLEQRSYITGIWTTSTYPFANSSSGSSGSTSSMAETVMSIAEAEIGTTETGDNNNKYGAELGMDGVPWCGIFVGWCLNKGGLGLPNFNYASAVAYAYAAQKNGWGQYHAQGSAYVPKRGDIFVRNYKGSDFESNGHVGFVRSCSGSTFTTVEGNSSDKVNTRTLNTASFTFVTPPYH